MPAYQIKPAIFDETDQVDALISRVFGPKRMDRTINLMRQNCQPMPELGLHARDTQGTLLGLVYFYAARIGDHAPVVPVLGPLAIIPKLRGIGIGKALVQRGIDAAKANGAHAIVIVGDPDYFGVFGHKYLPFLRTLVIT
ncbi:MAG: N-acetyltransferase, partial [Pseudomonadota bacterium]